ncbi:MAG: radical SAM protein [Candidatus Aureabacteria bacterium]|nr:radical SAM protein [Candidatus Auribacterota bacterium]
MRASMEQHPLKVLFWEATSACNLRCRHCRRMPAGAGAGARELTTDEAKSWIKDVAAWCRPLLILSGGEPLMRADIVELAAYAGRRGLAVALATNGVLMTGEIAGELRRAGVRRVSVSLDGARAGTHDGMRGVGGAFDAALNALRILRAAAVSAQINMTVCRGNRGEIEQIFILAEREGLQAVHFFVFVPVGCGLTFEKDQALSAVECEELLRWFRTHAHPQGLEVRLTCAPQYQRILAEHGVWPEESAPRRVGEPARRSAARPAGCLGGKSVCFVSHAGEVFPCGYLPVAAGSIRERSLREIWERSALFLELRDEDRLGAPCGTCAYKVTCGGCRARAYAATGNYLGGDRLCINPPPPEA